MQPTEAGHDEDYRLDKTRVRASFNRAAARYDSAAVLQREVGDRLLERLAYIRIMPERVADLGAGTGQSTRALAKRYKKAHIIALDLADNMLAQARRGTGVLTRLFNRQGYICGDAEHLPLAEQSVDLVFSNLTLQWCNDLDGVFREIKRVLKPGGLFLFTTFGPDTLRELRSCWSAIDGHQHVNAFIDMHDIGDALLRAALGDPVMDVEHITLTYPDVMRLMRELKIIGAHNATQGRPRHLTAKTRIQAVAAAYEQFRQQGVLPVTYEVVYGHAWAPAAGIRAGADAGIVKVPLSQLRRAPPGIR